MEVRQSLVTSVDQTLGTLQRWSLGVVSLPGNLRPDITSVILLVDAKVTHPFDAPAWVQALLLSNSLPHGSAEAQRGRFDCESVTDEATDFVAIFFRIERVWSSSLSG